MKEYAFTKWLVPTLQADGTERDMVYNEQMGIFTVCCVSILPFWN